MQGETCHTEKGKYYMISLQFGIWSNKWTKQTKTDSLIQETDCWLSEGGRIWGTGEISEGD